MRWIILLAAMCATPAMAQTAYPPGVQSVNGASGDVTVAVPTASTVTPPGVSDGGATGTMTGVYALANHTHASKARRAIFTSAADGTATWTYPTPFTNPPVCEAVAEVVAGVTDVVNVQIVGTPTVNSVTFLVNRTQRSVVALIGLTILSVPTTPGATKVHAICIEP